MRPDAEPVRRRLWPVLGALVLLAAPAPWGAGAAVALLAGRLLVASAHRLRAWRAASAERRPGSGTPSLGLDRRGHPLRLADEQLAAHGLIVGASGAGKTTTLLGILESHIRRGLPVIAIDLKGSPRFAAELERAARSAGREFRHWTPDGPVHWNPLHYGNPTQLKDKLIGAERFTEPHYKRAAERYLQVLCRALSELHPDRASTLDEVVRGLDPRWLSAVAGELGDERGEEIQRYLTGLTRDQVSGVRGLGTRLALITESHSGPYLSPAPAGTAEIDLRRALNGEQVVVFSLDAGSYGELSAQLGSLVIQDLKAAAAERLHDRDPPLALVALDEFSGLDSDNVLGLFARARESGISMILSTQELADLERVGRGLKDEIIGTTALKIAHRQDVPASAQLFAQMVGTEKTWEETRQIGGWPWQVDQGRGSRRQVESFIVHPNEIKTLRTGEAVVLSKTPRTTVRTVRFAPPRRRDGLER